MKSTLIVIFWKISLQDILPITFTFEIPYLNNENLRINQNSSVIQQIQNVYDVEIIFRNHYTLTPYSKTTVSVKGLTINAKKTKSVVHMLIKKYCTQNMVSVFFIIVSYYDYSELFEVQIFNKFMHFNVLWNRRWQLSHNRI